MVYDYRDTSDPPDLDSFKLELVQESLKRSFFQNVPRKTYQMLKLPLIVAPSLLREQTNNDIKESIVFSCTDNSFFYHPAIKTPSLYNRLHHNEEYSTYLYTKVKTISDHARIKFK